MRGGGRNCCIVGVKELYSNFQALSHVEFEAVMVLPEIMVFTATLITLVMHLVGKVKFYPKDIKT